MGMAFFLACLPDVMLCFVGRVALIQGKARIRARNRIGMEDLR